MENKEITERESRRNLTLSTLERTLMQNTLGANLASDVAMYGQKGKEAAKGAFDNDGIKQAKEKTYNELLQKYEAMGVAGEPTYPSNADIDRKSTRLNSSHIPLSRMPSSALKKT